MTECFVLSACALACCFGELSQLSREQVLTNVSLASADAAVGVASLVAGTLLFSYGLPQASSGRNTVFKSAAAAGTKFCGADSSR